MKHKVFWAFMGFIVVLGACRQNDLLEEMKKAIPLYEGATIVKSTSIPEENMSVIQYDVEASQVSEEALIDFYKDSMNKNGWELEEFKQWTNNGSVFSFTKKEWATLSIQIINTKQMKDIGKIKVVLNLTRYNL